MRNLKQVVAGWNVEITDINQDSSCQGHLHFRSEQWKEKYSTLLPPGAPDRCAVATAVACVKPPDCQKVGSLGTYESEVRCG